MVGLDEFAASQTTADDFIPKMGILSQKKREKTKNQEFFAANPRIY